MGLFNRKDKKIEERSDIIYPNSEGILVSSLLGTVEMTREKALDIPTVSGCIDFIANTISMIPIKLYENSEDGVIEAKDDPRVMLLNGDTGDTLDSVQFWRAILEDYFLGKGGYAYINRLGNQVKSINYVKDSEVSFQKSANPIFKDFNIMVYGKPYFPHQFLKFLRNSKDGASGTSIVSENELILSVAYQELIFEEALVKKGGNKKGFLKTESGKQLSKEALNDLRTGFNNLYSNNQEKFVLLNGVDFKEASNTSVEMQMNENKIANSAEICKIFSLSDSIVGGNPTEEDYKTSFKMGIMPVMRTIICALNRDFLLTREKGVKYFDFDTREIMKGDMKTRYDAYKIAIEGGFKTIDEIRYMENDPKLGISWINIGLASSLYDTETGDIYTPNTGATDNMENSASDMKNDDIDDVEISGEGGNDIED